MITASRGTLCSSKSGRADWMLLLMDCDDDALKGIVLVAVADDALLS
jgi:hypothetical protein